MFATLIRSGSAAAATQTDSGAERPLDPARDDLVLARGPWRSGAAAGRDGRRPPGRRCGGSSRPARRVLTPRALPAHQQLGARADERRLRRAHAEAEAAREGGAQAVEDGGQVGTASRRSTRTSRASTTFSSSPARITSLASATASHVALRRQHARDLEAAARDPGRRAGSGPPAEPRAARRPCAAAPSGSSSGPADHVHGRDRARFPPRARSRSSAAPAASAGATPTAGRPRRRERTRTRPPRPGRPPADRRAPASTTASRSDLRAAPPPRRSKRSASAIALHRPRRPERAEREPVAVGLLPDEVALLGARGSRRRRPRRRGLPATSSDDAREHRPAEARRARARLLDARRELGRVQLERDVVPALPRPAHAAH